MARDHALASCCEPGRGVVRFYQWDGPTVSFGRNEPVSDEYRRLRGGEYGFVRRPTGGRAVLHHDELTYSVVFPARALGALKGAYRTINEGLLLGLSTLGVPGVGLSEPSGRAAAPDAGPCFGAPAPGEVVTGGKKLVGSAQARIDGAILQHGSLLLVSDQASLSGPNGSRGATLTEVLGRVPEWGQLVEALEEGMRHALGGTWVRGDISLEESAKASELVTHYRDQTWTWKT